MTENEMQDGDFGISYRVIDEPEHLEECPQMLEDAEEFERAVKRYSKVKRVSGETATQIMFSNPALLKEWGVR